MTVFVLLMIAVNGAGLCLLERLPRRAAAAGDAARPQVGPNLALTGLLLAVNFAFDRATALAGFAPTASTSGVLGGRDWPAWATILVVVVILDGFAYAAHVLLHAWPPAWRFHRVHHSDPHVDVSTAFRQHPLETLWRHSFQTAGALLLGAPTRAVAVYLSLSALNAQLEHAHVTWPPRLERWTRLLFVTPAMHRVHHSRLPHETDTNYSNILSWWDRVFGTFRAPRPGESIACGLDEFDGPERQRTGALLALPFV
jgi:sterol desaturase/sphingolipid hydroxylase (fatty acid hydroxylase superfamily)